MERKVKAARISIISNLCLVLLKITVGLFMMSISVLSEAIHSTMDLIASLIANYSIKKAVEPADKEHPYGHGKYENLSGIIEAMFILIAGALIFYEAIIKLLSSSIVESIDLGIVVMGIAVVVNIVVSRYLYKVAREEDSMALEADAIHLRTDIWTAFSIFVGLILIKLTGIDKLDPLIALGVAMLIVRVAWNLIKRSGADLLDTSLGPEDEKLIKDVIRKHSDDFVSYHSLRTRKAGPERFVDLTLVIRHNLSVEEGHRLVDKLEKDIETSLKRTSVHIHIEPCDKDSCFKVIGAKVCMVNEDGKALQELETKHQ